MITIKLKVEEKAGVNLVSFSDADLSEATAAEKITLSQVLQRLVVAPEAKSVKVFRNNELVEEFRKHENKETKNC